jgi:hypothetical protein
MSTSILQCTAPTHWDVPEGENNCQIQFGVIEEQLESDCPQSLSRIDGQ